jgi:hypothetical protein
MFFRRHVFVNAAPGAKVMPSGTVTSATNRAQSHTGAAAAGTTPAVAAGTSENTSANDSTTPLIRNVDFMFVSFWGS